MKLTIEYIKGQHEYWKYRLGEKGIWNPIAFMPVTFEIRPKSRRINGLFQRHIKRKGLKKEITDKIIIYKNGIEDFDEKYLNSVIVHEMIHQYIIQGGLKDTSSHGQLFKSLMNRINKEFEGSLDISVKGHNPSIPIRGEGDLAHLLLLLTFEKEYLCCVVIPSRMEEIEKIVSRHSKLWGVRNYRWGVSRDLYFNSFVRCSRTIHGKKIKLCEAENFCREFSIKLL